jgi:hypothetical protein
LVLVAVAAPVQPGRAEKQASKQATPGVVRAVHRQATNSSTAQKSRKQRRDADAAAGRHDVWLVVVVVGGGGEGKGGKAAGFLTRSPKHACRISMV